MMGVQIPVIISPAVYLEAGNLTNDRVQDYLRPCAHGMGKAEGILEVLLQAQTEQAETNSQASFSIVGQQNTNNM